MKSSLILGATLALTSAVAIAQTTAKPSPYEGLSQPPASDVIRATESPAAVPPAMTAPAACAHTAGARRGVRKANACRKHSSSRKSGLRHRRNPGDR